MRGQLRASTGCSGPANGQRSFSGKSVPFLAKVFLFWQKCSFSGKKRSFSGVASGNEK
jgi:hypothetical protein